MGPYCKFCDTRCFVQRTVAGRSLLMATCSRGAAFDRLHVGYDWRAAVNNHVGQLPVDPGLPHVVELLARSLLRADRAKDRRFMTDVVDMAEGCGIKRRVLTRRFDLVLEQAAS